jgi:hypothetical protein
MVRVILLVVAILVSIPVTSAGLGLLSAPNDAEVVAGIVVLLGLLVAWYYGGRLWVKSVAKSVERLL